MTIVGLPDSPHPSLFCHEYQNKGVTDVNIAKNVILKELFRIWVVTPAFSGRCGPHKSATLKGGCTRSRKAVWSALLSRGKKSGEIRS